MTWPRTPAGFVEMRWSGYFLKPGPLLALMATGLPMTISFDEGWYMERLSGRGRVPVCRSIRLRAARLHHFRPFGDFVADQLVEFFRLASGYFHALFGKPCPDVRRSERLEQRRMQPVHDRARRARRHEHAVPRVRFG